MNYLLTITCTLSMILSALSLEVFASTQHPQIQQSMMETGASSPIPNQDYPTPPPTQIPETLAENVQASSQPQSPSDGKQQQSPFQQKIFKAIIQKGEYERGVHMHSDPAKFIILRAAYDEADKILDLTSPDVLEALKALSITPKDIETYIDHYRKLGKALNRYIEIRLERDQLETSGNKNQRFNDLENQLNEPRNEINLHATAIKNALIANFDPYEGFKEEMASRQSSQDAAAKAKPSTTVETQSNPNTNGTNNMPDNSHIVQDNLKVNPPPSNFDNGQPFKGNNSSQSYGTSR